MKLKHLLENRVSAEEQLTDYYRMTRDEDRSFFISYTDINKIGINPQSRFNTPIGIYCYPLKEAFEEYDLEEDVTNVPYAGNASYLWVIEPKDITIFDTHTYSLDDLNKDIDELYDFISRWIDKGAKFYWDSRPLSERKIFDDMIRTSMDYAVVGTPAGQIWNITRVLASAIAGRYKNSPPVWWNTLLNRVLGYDCVVDRGMGVVHKSEPIQAVFFAKSYFNVVDLIRNSTTSKEQHKIIQQARELLKTANTQVQKAQQKNIDPMIVFFAFAELFKRIKEYSDNNPINRIDSLVRKAKQSYLDALGNDEIDLSEFSIEKLDDYVRGGFFTKDELFTSSEIERIKKIIQGRAESG